MAGKKLTQQESARIADPSTYAAMDAAQAAGEALFGPCIETVVANLTALLLAQKERRLTAVEAAQVIALQACLDTLATQHRRFVGANLVARLDLKGESQGTDD